MKALAQWAMKGRWQATVAAAGCFAIPLLFWLGAAVVALVILRHGLREGGKVVLWSLLPAIAWLAMGDPTPLLAAAGTAVTALVLRQTIRLDRAVVVAGVLGILAYVLLPYLLADVLPAVEEASQKAVSEALQNDPEFLARLQPMVGPMISGVLAALHVLVIILCLLLGRYWQSALFNPGGFGREFKQLRLPLAYSLPALLASLAAGQLQPELAGVTPVLTVPLMIAGLALFHGLVAKSQASPNWMVLVYLALVVFGPYMYTLLIFGALLDSLVDFRARLKDTAGDA